MKVLAIEKVEKDLPDQLFEPHVKAEATRVWELYQAGSIRELYFRSDREEAILVLECTDIHEASKMIKTLPLVKEGLIDFDLIPLRAYPGFERLFASQT